MDWFMNKRVNDGCGEMVKKFKGDAESFIVPGIRPSYYDKAPEEDRVYLDEKYATAKMKWDEWEKCNTDEKKKSFREKYEMGKNETPLSPDDIRSFKFLPLFKRIKI